MNAPTYHRVKECDAYGPDVRLHIGDNEAEDDVTALVTWPTRYVDDENAEFEQRGPLPMFEALSLARDIAAAQSLDITVALESDRDELWDETWGQLAKQYAGS